MKYTTLNSSLLFILLMFTFTSNGWNQTTEGAAIKPNDIGLPTFNNHNSEKINSIISFAKSFIGTPYHWGGITPSGFDCSGFINYIFGNFGFSLSRTCFSLAELGESIKIENLQAGDLMFFKGSNASSSAIGHVAMVIEVTPDAIRFIHSANSGVRIDNFKSSKYYITRYLKSKRLDYTPYKIN